MRPREGARSNPPPADLYSERLQDLPSGFRRWKVSMHWGRIKSRREAIQTILGVVSFSLILHFDFALFVLLCGVGSPFHCLPPAPLSWTTPSLPHLRKLTHMHAARGNMGPDARRMQQWQEDHNITDGGMMPKVAERDKPLEHRYCRMHASINDPWVPIRFPGC